MSLEYKTDDCVWLQVRPQGRSFTQHDADMVRMLVNFINDNDHDAMYTCHVGGGYYSAIHRKEDAEKITAWLSEQGFGVAP